MKTKHTATLFAILAAALYAINIPVSKILLKQVEPTMMAAFLYLGAGVGLFALGAATKEKGEKLTKAELPYTIGMVVLDIAAPILLMLGLERTSTPMGIWCILMSIPMSTPTPMSTAATKPFTTTTMPISRNMTISTRHKK